MEIPEDPLSRIKVLWRIPALLRPKEFFWFLVAIVVMFLTLGLPDYHSILPFRDLSPTIAYAMLVSTFCLTMTTIVLVFALPIYLFSADRERSRKAGGLVKTAFGFLIASGSAVIGTLSFVEGA